MQEIKTILTPIDFSENSLKIAQKAAYVAGAFKADLHFCFVVQGLETYSGFFTSPAMVPNLEEEIFIAAQKKMELFIKENEATLTKYGSNTIKSKILSGDVANEILDYAATIDCNLIVMGTHGYKGLERILFGSVAEQVVKTSCCPVMTINPYREECEKEKKQG